VLHDGDGHANESATEFGFANSDSDGDYENLDELDSPSPPPKTPPEEEGSAVPMPFRGQLERREGGVRKKWGKYDAILAASCLSLSRERKRPVLTVNTRGMDMTREPPTKGKASVVFTLRGGRDQSHTFRASSEFEFQRWAKALADDAHVVMIEPRDRTSTMPASRKASLAQEQVQRHSVAVPGDALAASVLEDDELAASDMTKEAPTIKTVRKKMTRFLRARPRRQELVSKGIIEMPVFGGTIDSIVKRELGRGPVPNVPAVVSQVGRGSGGVALAALSRVLCHVAVNPLRLMLFSPNSLLLLFFLLSVVCPVCGHAAG
jgi:hypothetical protein